MKSRKWFVCAVVLLAIGGAGVAFLLLSSRESGLPLNAEQEEIVISDDAALRHDPAEFIDEVAQRLKPGGLLVLETPDIGSWPYRVFRTRWRQFIPEHYKKIIL